jgi:transposase
MRLSRVGVDLAKDVYQLHGVDRHGKTVWKRRLRRGQWLQALLDKVKPGCEIGMEACTGAHHWARELQSQGYTVRLIAPQFVKPCEAMSRPHMRFVSVKSVEQQDIQATHRIREELKAHRNAKANQIRGLVAEYGLVAPQGLLALRRTIPEWLEDAENGLTDSFRSLLHGVWSDLLALEERLKELDKQIEKLARGNEVAKRLQQLRGVGPLVATALVATVGDGKQYGKGRQMASVSQARHRDDPLSRWVTDIAKRRHPNVAAVALAKKTARMAWAMLQNDTDYDPSLATS